MNKSLALNKCRNAFFKILAISGGDCLKMYSSTLSYLLKKIIKTVIAHSANSKGSPLCTSNISKMPFVCFKILNHYRIFNAIFSSFMLLSRLQPFPFCRVVISPYCERPKIGHFWVIIWLKASQPQLSRVSQEYKALRDKEMGRGEGALCLQAPVSWNQPTLSNQPGLRPS